MEIDFRSKNEKQIQAAEAWLDDSVEQILYGGAKGGGKSYLGASLIFGDALIYPDTHYFIARKELNDLRKFTIPTIHKVFHGFGLDFDKYASYNGQDNFFKLYNGSVVYLLACKEEPSDPLFERFGSMEMTRGWIEEGGEVQENAFSNLWLSIGRWKNDVYGLKKKMLITANPKKGWMKRDFVDPAKNRTLAPARRYIQAFASDNAAYLPADYLKSLSSDRDKVRRQRLWEGKWDYDEDADALVSYDALSDAFTNTIDEEEDNYLIVDVARLGRDSTVFNFFKGLRSYKRVRYQKQGTDQTIQKVKDAAAAERIPRSRILIDEDGVGGGVVDQLRGVKGFTANSTPIPTGAQIREKQAKLDHFLVPKTTFMNLKAQCGWKLAELVNEHKLAIDDGGDREAIIEELSAELRDADPAGDGKKRLRAKDEVKQELGRSPDIGDTFIMRAFFELTKDAQVEDPIERKRVVEEQRVHFAQRRKGSALHSTR